MSGVIIDNGFLGTAGVGWGLLGGLLCAVGLVAAILLIAMLCQGEWLTAGMWAFVGTLAFLGGIALVDKGYAEAAVEHVDFYAQLEAQGFEDVDVNRDFKEMTARVDGELNKCHFVHTQNWSYKIFCED